LEPHALLPLRGHDDDGVDATTGDPSLDALLDLALESGVFGRQLDALIEEAVVHALDLDLEAQAVPLGRAGAESRHPLDRGVPRAHPAGPPAGVGIISHAARATRAMAPGRPRRPRTSSRPCRIVRAASGSVSRRRVSAAIRRGVQSPCTSSGAMRLPAIRLGMPMFGRSVARRASM